MSSHQGGPLERLYAGYTAGGKKRAGFPLTLYMGVLAFYNSLLGRLLWKGELPTQEEKRLSLEDLVLLGVSVHKLSRIITKDVVTAPFRAPFTQYEELLGYGEVQEDSRGQGLRQVIGEMLSCNYCADPWIALGLSYGLEFAPTRTRFLLRFFSAVALADFMHVSYEVLRTRENVLTLREDKMEREEKRAG